MEKDAKSGNDDAAAAWLIYKMGLRPGSDKDAKAEVKAYGATTLLADHVIKKNGKTLLKFTSKKGVHTELEVHDKDLEDMLLDRKRTARSRDGRLFTTDEAAVNKYVDEVAGVEFSAKDFRTARGTYEAKKLIDKMPKPKDEKELKKFKNEVGDKVSAILGNTERLRWRRTLIRQYSKTGRVDSMEASDWDWMNDVYFIDGEGELVDLDALDASGDTVDPDDELTQTHEEIIALLGYDPRDVY